jgi:hypothetical protein
MTISLPEMLLDGKPYEISRESIEEMKKTETMLKKEPLPPVKQTRDFIRPVQ